MKSGQAIAGAIILTTVGMGFGAGQAGAHTAQATPSCYGLTVDVAAYPEVTTTIVIDGASQTRSGNGSWTFEWDPSRSHTWSVTVDGAGSDEFDRSFSGTEAACVSTSTAAPTTTAAEAPTTTSPAPTTTVAGSTPPPASTTTTAAPTTNAPGPTTTAPQGVSPSGGSPSNRTPQGVTPSGGSPSNRTPQAAQSASDAAPRTLPATGYGTSVIAAVAAMMLAGGAALLAVARRQVS